MGNLIIGDWATRRHLAGESDMTEMTETTWEEFVLKAQRAAEEGDYKAAEGFLNDAKSLSDGLADNDKRRFLILEMLADLMEREERTDDAEKYLLAAVECRKTRYGPFHYRYAEGVQRLSSFYFENDRFEESEKLTRDVLKIMEKAYGPTSEEVGHIAGQLADTIHELGKHQDAEELYKRAIGIRRHASGSTDSESVYLIQRYAALLEETGRADEAAHMRASAQGKISGILRKLKPSD
ncbi:tetratricopeptide repeat protein [Candidatus Obscuribacterales bacterium]|nr:tetratricopeptide repeat protein [Candidatus Obscuribacterales bacterium]